jgi:hypothetical protein
LDANFARKPKNLRFIRENRKLIFALVLPVYLFIVQSSITNRHSHFCANGMVITHSHPFDHHERGATKHNHTQKEICFYTSLNAEFYHSEPETFVHGFQGSYLLLSQPFIIVIPQSEFHGQFWLRGPPASCSC